MATLTFDHDLKRITVNSPQTEVTIQDLYNQAKDEEDFPHIAMTTGVILTATGKESLGGGIQVGVTLVMRNGWKVGFGDRGSPIQCNVTGGNIVAESEVIGAQFFQSVNVQINYQSSSSPTIQATNDEQIKFMVESQRPHHEGFGRVLFWDPINGDDLLDGSSVKLSVKTFSRAHDLSVDGEHVIIFALPDANALDTIVTENIVISKSYIFLRGSGRHFLLKPTSGNPISITGIGVEISGFEISGTGAAGSNAGIKTTGDFTYIHNVRIVNTTSHGIEIEGTNQFILESTIIGNSSSNGIQITDSTSLIIDETIVNRSTLDGINIVANTPNSSLDILIKETTVSNSGNYSLNVTSSDVGDVGVYSDSILDGAGLGRINDLGSNTVDFELANKTFDIRAINVFDEEWVSPGILKKYDKNGKAGGVTLFEWETRDSSGVQTFDIIKVRQFIKTKG